MHFLGWNSKLDQWISCDSHRLKLRSDEGGGLGAGNSAVPIGDARCVQLQSSFHFSDCLHLLQTCVLSQQPIVLAPARVFTICGKEYDADTAIACSTCSLLAQCMQPALHNSHMIIPQTG